MDKEDKRKMEEYKKNPMTNLADAINRSQMGDLSQLAKGNATTRIVTGVIVIGMLVLIYLSITN